MLKVDGLNQYYGGSHILRNVGLSAALGEVTVVLGRNGVGKTTLLKIIAGRSKLDDLSTMWSSGGMLVGVVAAFSFVVSPSGSS